MAAVVRGQLCATLLALLGLGTGKPFACTAAKNFVFINNISTFNVELEFELIQKAVLGEVCFVMTQNCLCGWLHYANFKSWTQRQLYVVV